MLGAQRHHTHKPVGREILLMSVKHTLHIYVGPSLQPLARHLRHCNRRRAVTQHYCRPIKAHILTQTEVHLAQQSFGKPAYRHAFITCSNSQKPLVGISNHAFVHSFNDIEAHIGEKPINHENQKSKRKQCDSSLTQINTLLHTFIAVYDTSILMYQPVESRIYIVVIPVRLPTLQGQ